MKKDENYLLWEVIKNKHNDLLLNFPNYGMKHFKLKDELDKFTVKLNAIFKTANELSMFDEAKNTSEKIQWNKVNTILTFLFEFTETHSEFLSVNSMQRLEKAINHDFADRLNDVNKRVHHLNYTKSHARKLLLTCERELDEYINELLLCEAKLTEINASFESITRQLDFTEHEMTEEIYKENEKELISILQFMQEWMMNLPFNSEVDIEYKKMHSGIFKQEEDSIIRYAERRKEFIVNLEKDKYRRLYETIEVQCDKCFVTSDLKPVGEQQNMFGLRACSYLCPNCGARFSDEIPLFDSDMVKNSELMIAALEKAGNQQEKINQLKEGILIFNETNARVDKSNADSLNLDVERGKFVKDEIIRLSVYKHNILTGNHTANEIN